MNLPYRKRRYLIRGLMSSALLVIVFWLVSAVQVWYYARPIATVPKDVEAAIVLGAAAWGERPSPVFRERINHAITLYQNGHVPVLIFTGGTSKAGFMTEAEVGRRFALKQGVAKEDILFENTSKDTYQNLSNVKSLMYSYNIEKVLIVSDPYHMARAVVMAQDLGIDAVYSPTPTSRYNESSRLSKLRFFLQESYALSVYRVMKYF